MSREANETRPKAFGDSRATASLLRFVRRVHRVWTRRGVAGKEAVNDQDLDLDVFSASANGGGVDFAHVGGFLFGLVVTLILSAEAPAVLAPDGTHPRTGPRRGCVRFHPSRGRSS